MSMAMRVVVQVRIGKRFVVRVARMAGVMVPMVPVATVAVEQVHHRAREQQQVGPVAGDVPPVLAQQEEGAISAVIAAAIHSARAGRVDAADEFGACSWSVDMVGPCRFLGLQPCGGMGRWLQR